MRLPVLFTLVAAALACGDGPIEPGFGAHYRVELEPDIPVLTATTVSVTVSYGGCGGNRDFEIRQRLRSDAAEIWLRKITPDEPCDRYVTERRTFVVPWPARTAAMVTLLAPDLDPYQLRP